MVSMMIEAAQILAASLVVTGIAVGLLFLRPSKRRQRRRRRHSARPRIDLFKPVKTEAPEEKDA